MYPPMKRQHTAYTQTILLARFTTTPHLSFSRMQQCHLNPTILYSMMNPLPFLESCRPLLIAYSDLISHAHILSFGIIPDTPSQAKKEKVIGQTYEYERTLPRHALSLCVYVPIGVGRWGRG